MITTNLISARRTEQLRHQQMGLWLLRAAAVMAMLTVLYIGWGIWCIRAVKQEITQTDMQKIAYRDQANEVKRLRTVNGSLQPRVDMVQQADRRLDHWRYLYAQVARSLPEDVRLESIDFMKANDGTKTLQILGRGDNAYAISRTMLALSAQPGFSDVAMGPISMATPHEATLNARLSIKPLPEDSSQASASTAGAK